MKRKQHNQPVKPVQLVLAPLPDPYSVWIHPSMPQALQHQAKIVCDYLQINLLDRDKLEPFIKNHDWIA